MNWDIHLEVVPGSALPRNIIGDVTWGPPGKAVIRVLDELGDDRQLSRIRSNMEETIVHELVHLHVVFEPGFKKNGRAEEKIVNRISDNLLRVDRLQARGVCLFCAESSAPPAFYDD
jgi:hypothetical protein